MLSISTLPSRKVGWLKSMTLLITFFSLRDKIFDTILFTHPTNEMSLKSLSCCELSDLIIKHINEVFYPLGHLHLTAKSFIADRISSFRQSQQKLMKLKLKASEPRLFELSQFQTVVLTSSSEKALTNNALSSLEIELKQTLSNLTWGLETPSNLALKKSPTFALTTSLSSHHWLFSRMSLIPFLALLHFTIQWKNFVFKSPCFSHLRQPLYCKTTSCLKNFPLCFANKSLLTSLPGSSRSLS